MRIISGKYRGRRINPPTGFKARPTTDFARESLFNILSVRYTFEELSVLDLFSGTGCVGIEFASRGCPRVDMVENNFRHFSFIRKTLSTLDLPGSRVFHSNVKSFIKGADITYDIVFADPPYDLEWLGDIPALILESGILNDSAVFILEHPKNLHFGNHPNFSEHRKYGNVNFTFFTLSY
ncbi:MAG TPA: RsmD family RNA methyltransferase [Bacteroidales bacterium]|nr:RsmD family RNA methyltransferase [Bacteroidales bacterium]